MIVIYLLILIILLLIPLTNNDIIIILILRFNKYLYKYTRYIKIILYFILNEISFFLYRDLT